MRPSFVVVAAPGFDCGTSVKDRREGVFIEEFIPESAVKAFDASVLHRATWFDEMQVLIVFHVLGG